MFENYFKIAIRSLLKNKLFSFINIFGLALGMSCSLLIWLWIKDEISFNSFYPNLENIYNVRSGSEWKGEYSVGDPVPGPWLEAIQKEVPEVAAITKITWNRNLLLKAGEKSTKENGIYATSDFFKVFQTPFVAGNPKTAIEQPTSIAISRKLAEKYFGKTDVVGRTFRLDNATDLIVSAVFEDIPHNSSVRFDWIVNFKVQEQDWMKWWGNSSFKIYALLAPNANPQNAEKVMQKIIKKNAPPQLISFPVIQSMKDHYLFSEYEGLKATGGRIEYVRAFGIVAIFILLIACVNFMNLATARSVKRAKEVGVRKVVGAEKKFLVVQFIGESLIVSILAAVLALIFVLVLLPVFNQVVEKQIIINFTDPVLWLTLVGLVCITGLVAGSYPALYLSALQPIRILKGRLTFSNKSNYLRKGLVVFQFGLSIFLIIGMLVIGRQMNYIQTKRLGLDRENVLYISLEGDLYKKLEAFRQEILNSPSVAAATTTGELPTDISGRSGDLDWAGRDKELSNTVSATYAGYDFVKTMNIKILSGRDFSPEFPGDTSNYIINEAAAKMMNMKDPVGKKVKFWMGEGTIVGLMKDFHLNSFHRAIEPLILVNYKGQNTEFMMIRTLPGKTEEAIKHIENVTRAFNPNYPFAYHFLDEDYEKMYRSEMIVNTLIKYFGILAIVISCLGLLGLAAFTAEQRTKEIGIRKVMGANVSSVVTLLSKEFVKLILIAIVITSPVAWYLMNKWLSDFIYHIDLTADIFIISGVIALSIALFTVSFQSVKAALMNPIASLQSE
ncbi:hypothetical protein DYBT9275_03772 [Dyadobacter sp. CECT 9275]|uniref:FtsX-like permease family protein n=1 Tax=Dyadobacter helix TaxID=2822344 RepID=A0A916JI85_9BACT|nr:ABC transporter permease [Dyadobacter sp. CECT 9275]CAG5006253.1 hypothetical protein DYBT9275_03772 [Dyadobacter sp. CECT 9275]